MGAGKTTIGAEVAARLGRVLVDTDRDVEELTGKSIAQLLADGSFRAFEEEAVVDALELRYPAVIALGGGAVTSRPVRIALKEAARTVWLEVDVDAAWERARSSGRPLAQDENEFRRLYEERRPLYEEVADAVATDADGVVLAAGDVVAEAGGFARLAELDARAVELVSDARVLELHRPPLEAPTHVLPEGEAAKTVAEVERLWRTLRLDRSGMLVALGGGCVTDAAGFTAATYLRGIDWWAVPTTLVGQVDAAIGGKTAINVPEGKNLVGAFHWPAQTLIDPSVLATLPEEQRRAGMAEVVKTGLLAGEPLWTLDDEELVRRCATFKTAICLRDPHDRGVRQTLNLGHTFAHALEAAADFELGHGNAVALGLLAALRLSGQPTDAVEAVLAPERVRIDRERAWAALQRDKKSTGGELTLVLLGDDGGFTAAVPAADVRRALDELIAE
jgi:shikimate kinase / 3-dehydroquinate synthase